MTSISVIVPCYNMKEYTRECMESIFAQTLNGLEIICIDDGSTDGTFEILEEYQKKADFIKVLRQNNQGSGIARNRGIMEAKGEYIAFMDADDFYPSPNTLEKVYAVAKEKKAVICGGSASDYRSGVFTCKEYAFSEDGWVNKKDFSTISGYWRFIYKSDFIKSKQIFFPEYLRCQDPPFFLTAIAHAEWVYCMKEVTYIYRRNHKRVIYSQRKAIDYAKGIRDSLVISKREGMVAAYRYTLDILRGFFTACIYPFAEECVEMRGIIHQINEVIDDGSDSEVNVPLLKEGEELLSYLKGMEIAKQRLLERLRKENKVLIFGAGIIGRRVRAFLEKSEVAMEAFVVSDVARNDASVDGLQVKCIDDYTDVRNDCLVIIATSSALQEEIKDILQRKGFEKVYPLSLEKFYFFEGQIMQNMKMA